MIGKITVKRALKKGAGMAAAAGRNLLAARRPTGVCIFAYHRVAEIPFIDPNLDDWNVPPAMFEKHLAAFSEFAEVIPLEDVFRRLEGPSSKPLVSLTFDDGYANFCTQALPLLKRYGIPASLFVVTDVVGLQRPMPFDGWSLANASKTPEDAWRPISWDELNLCAASGLVRIGSHSHRHGNGLKCTMEQLFHEAEESRAILRSRMGDEAGRMYSYPYGSRRLGQVSDDYVEAVREAGYSFAVTTDLGIARANSDPLALPRIEAHAVDSARVLRAKAAGILAPYRLTDMLRRAERSVAPS